MKSILTIYDIIFNSDLNEVLGFTNRKYEAGMHLKGEIIKTNSTDTVHLKTNWVNGCLIDGKRENSLFVFSLNAKPGYKICKKTYFYFVQKVNKIRLLT